MKYNKLSIFTFCGTFLMWGVALLFWRPDYIPSFLRDSLISIILLLPIIVIFAGIVSLYQIKHRREKGMVFILASLFSAFVLGVLVWKYVGIVNQM